MPILSAAFVTGGSLERAFDAVRKQPGGIRVVRDPFGLEKAAGRTDRTLGRRGSADILE